MREKVEQKNSYYYYILYALLHDIGKPIQRFARRYLEGLEGEKEAAERARQLLESKVVGRSIEEVSTLKHDDLSRFVFNWLLGVAPARQNVEKVLAVLSEADPLAAAERGYEAAYAKEYGECIGRLTRERVLERISEKLSQARKESIRYDYHVAPMLSPLWVVAATRYLDHVGVIAFSRGRSGLWSGDEARTELARLLEPVLAAIEGCEADRIVDEMAALLERFLDEDLWFPSRSLRFSDLLELRGLSYTDAVQKTSYSSIVLDLIDELNAIKQLYGPYPAGDPILRSISDTLLYVLKATLLLVPSAVFASIVPDISLYSHSKLVAAYTASELVGGGGHRILVIDASGIQSFVSAPVYAKAASRVMRGRSLLVELAMDSLSRYVLELFGGLPRANIIVQEGGVVEILVPDVGVEKRVEKLRDIADKLASKELGYSLGFTIAFSDPFDTSKAFFLHALRAGGGFLEVVNSLSEKLALEKARRGVKKVYHDNRDIVGFDSITREPVVKGQEYSFKVVEENKKYVDELAPEKLSENELVSETTHFSLVAGTAARNLIAILAIHVYSDGKEGYIVPDEEAARQLADEIISRMLADCGEGRGRRLYCRLKHIDIRWSMGVIPLVSSGSIYLLLSLTMKEPFNPGKLSHLRSAWAFIGHVLESLRPLLRGYA
ncbi:MAG: hypothetical protein ABWW69_04140, partial [Pyrodictiaceae archaeon]